MANLLANPAAYAADDARWPSLSPSDTVSDPESAPHLRTAPPLEEAPAPEPERDTLLSRIAASMHRLNWVAIGTALALEGVFFAALLSMGIVSVSTARKQAITVFNIPVSTPEPASAPAAEPAPPQTEEAKPTPQQPRTEIIAPKPKIAVKTAETQIAVATPDPTPAPSSAPANGSPTGQAPASGVPGTGSGPVSVSNLNTNLIQGTPPAYPRSSRRKREQGTVVLKLVIKEDGRVANAAIHKSSGFSALDDAALAAVRGWRWSPTIREGQKVQITGLVQIPFVLKDT